MKNLLIILAGPPATGKTYFSNLFTKRFGSVPILSPDLLQEMYADQTGFKNAAEKVGIYNKAWATFYDMLNYFMLRNEKIILLDYPFSQKQKNNLKASAEKSDYFILTLRFKADIDVLYQRRRKRDLSSEWHLSHLVDKYLPGDNLKSVDRTALVISKVDFEKKILASQYNQFELGQTVAIDTTKFGPNLDQKFNEVFSKIKNLLQD